MFFEAARAVACPPHCQLTRAQALQSLEMMRFLPPEKLILPRLMKEVKDITQIMFQIAVTTGVLIALF